MSSAMPVNGSKLPWRAPTVGQFTHAEAIAKGVVSADELAEYAAQVAETDRSNDPLAKLFQPGCQPFGKGSHEAVAVQETGGKGRLPGNAC